MYMLDYTWIGYDEPEVKVVSWKTRGKFEKRSNAAQRRVDNPYLCGIVTLNQTNGKPQSEGVFGLHAARPGPVMPQTRISQNSEQVSGSDPRTDRVLSKGDCGQTKRRMSSCGAR